MDRSIRYQSDDIVTRNPETGRLYLWFPIGLAMRKVRRHLRASERPFGSPSTVALVVDGQDAYLERLLAEVSALLTADEAAETRWCFTSETDDDEAPGIDGLEAEVLVTRLSRSTSWHTLLTA